LGERKRILFSRERIGHRIGHRIGNRIGDRNVTKVKSNPIFFFFLLKNTSRSILNSFWPFLEKLFFFEKIVFRNGEGGHSCRIVVVAWRGGTVVYDPVVIICPKISDFGGA